MSRIAEEALIKRAKGLDKLKNYLLTYDGKKKFNQDQVDLIGSIYTQIHGSYDVLLDSLDQKEKAMSGDLEIEKQVNKGLQKEMDHLYGKIADLKVELMMRDREGDG